MAGWAADVRGTSTANQRKSGMCHSEATSVHLLLLRLLDFILPPDRISCRARPDGTAEDSNPPLANAKDGTFHCNHLILLTRHHGDR